MKILFISSQFPNAAEPDKGIFSLQIASEMALQSDIKIIAPVPTSGLFSLFDPIKKYNNNLNIPNSEIIAGMTVSHPKYVAIPGMGFVHHLASFKSLEPIIKSIHDDWIIDVVNCHWLFPDGVAVQRICNKYNIPVMLTALGCDLNRYIKYPTRRNTIRNALIKSDKVSVLNSDMHSKCVALGVNRDNICVIPNGVDLFKFKIKDKIICRNKLGMLENARIILFVGSLVEVKNVETLLKSFRIILNDASFADTKLILVGSGYLDRKLKQLSKTLYISDNVEFVGQVKHEKLSDWMNAADCLCLPSLREGHPNVMMEALACGIPVVASSVGSIPDFINIRNGNILYNIEDPVELAVKLCLSLSSNYDRVEIRGSVVKHSWADCASHYINELAKIAS